MDTNILTSNGIDINKGLELLGDMEMYNDTLRDFIQESATRMPAISNALATGDMENYGILTHAMKSDSKYLGFTTLAEMSYQHQDNHCNDEADDGVNDVPACPGNDDA